MTVVKKKKDFFKKLGVSVRKKIFREIVAKKLEINIKPLGNQDVFHLSAYALDGDVSLVCRHFLDQGPRSLESNVVASFDHKGQKYFFNTILNYKTGRPILKTDVDLFQLQRRANTRIEIPEEYDALFTITSVAGYPCELPCRLLDISAGGIQIEFPDESVLFKSGDHITGSLKLTRRDPMTFEAEIRFSKRKHVDSKTTVQAIGLKFLGREGRSSLNLINVMTEVQRELFLQFPHKVTG